MTIAKGPRLEAAMQMVERFSHAGVTTGSAAAGKRPDPQASPVGWPITRAGLVQQVRHRLAGRDLPRQVQTSYCGPAAFLYCLIEDRPDLYAAYAIAMWSRGEYDFSSPQRSMEIASDAGIRGALQQTEREKPKETLISGLDWMTMAPLSASTRPFNRVSSSPKPNDQFGSISYPDVVRGWFAAVGASLRMDTMGLGLMKTLTERTLKLLSNWSANWIVLQIDSSLLRGGGVSTNTFANRHWVVVNPHRQPLVRVEGSGKIVPMADALSSATADQAHPDMSKWQTSLYFASWGDENTPLQDQHLGHLTGRIYGGFAFSRIP